MPHGNRLRRLRPIRRIISIGCGDFQRPPLVVGGRSSRYREGSVQVESTARAGGEWIAVACYKRRGPHFFGERAFIPMMNSERCRPSTSRTSFRAFDSAPPAACGRESRWRAMGDAQGACPSRGFEWSRGESNRQAPPKSRRKGDRLTTRAAQGAARRAARGDMRASERNITTRPAAPAESDITNEPSFTLLARLVAAWPDLPAEVRAQIAEALRKATDGAA